MQTYRDIEITPAANGYFSVVLGGEEFVERITDVRLIIDEVLAASFYYRGILCAPIAGPEHGIHDSEGYRFVINGRCHFIALDEADFDDEACREACRTIIDRTLA